MIAEHIPLDSKAIRIDINGKPYAVITSGIAKGTCLRSEKKVFRKAKWQEINLMDSPEEVKDIHSTIMQMKFNDNSSK